jgi:hypothetical protein
MIAFNGKPGSRKWQALYRSAQARLDLVDRDGLKDPQL